MLKVGSAKNVEKRLDQVNKELYGQTNDWILLSKIRHGKSGFLEFSIQSKLSPLQAETKYWKNNSWQKCYEIFICQYSDAKLALLEVLPEGIRSSLEEFAAKVESFESYIKINKR